MKLLPYTKSCFVCGEANPIGLRLKFETDGQVVRARFRPAPEHIGFKQVVHGGIIATVLDEIMVWACAVPTGRFAYCVELNVRFARPARPGQDLTISAELTDNRRDRLFAASSRLADETGNVLATATGKYLAMKEADVSEMLTELIGGADFLRPPI